MWHIFLIIALSAVRINSSENCSKSAGVILINRTNKTIPSEYLKDFDEISRVLAGALNSKSSDNEEILPHNIVPKIANAEKGENFSLLTKWRQGHTHQLHPPTKTCLVAFDHRQIFPSLWLDTKNIFICVFAT